MTPEFLAAVIDSLLPGEQTASPGAAPLPSATGAGLEPTAYAASHRAVFDAIAAQAGGAELFARADEAGRTAILQPVERAIPDAFRALVVAVHSDYYESPPALAAIGWRADPPQPVGHLLPGMDSRSFELLERVRQRDRLWRPQP